MEAHCKLPEWQANVAIAFGASGRVAIALFGVEDFNQKHGRLACLRHNLAWQDCRCNARSAARRQPLPQAWQVTVNLSRLAGCCSTSCSLPSKQAIRH